MRAPPRSGRRKPTGPGGGGRKSASQGVDVLRNRARMCGSPDGKASGPEHRGNAGIDTKRCRSEEHTSELQSLMRISYAVFCLKKKKNIKKTTSHIQEHE